MNNYMNLQEQQQQQMLINKEVMNLATTNIRNMTEAGELHVPPHYSPENALKSAMLMMDDVKDRNGVPALQVVSKASAANALLDMVVQGLNPSKKQGYFIVYGKNLVFQRSYFGDVTLLKRAYKVKSLNAVIVFEGDNVTYEMIDGEVVNLKHSQTFGNRDTKKIIGAYAIVKFEDGTQSAEIMTMEEIKASWSMGKTGTRVHDKFPQEMAKKTVIRRLCKRLINSSDDEALFEDDEVALQDQTESLREVIEENANMVEIDIDEAPTVTKPKQEPKNLEEVAEVVEAHDEPVSEVLESGDDLGDLDF